MEPVNNMVESEMPDQASYSQSGRLQTRISSDTFERLKPILVDRKGAQTVVDEAEGIGLREALRYSSMDVIREGRYARLTVTPSQSLLDKAERDFISPHVFIRAAAVKIGERLFEEAELAAELAARAPAAKT